MKLEKILDMYLNASSASMSLHLATGEVVTVSRNQISHLRNDGETMWENVRNEEKGEFPWLILKDKYGDRDIAEFSTYDNSIIFWERGHYNDSKRITCCTHKQRRLSSSCTQTRQTNPYSSVIEIFVKDSYN